MKIFEENARIEIKGLPSHFGADPEVEHNLSYNKFDLNQKDSSVEDVLVSVAKIGRHHRAPLTRCHWTHMEHKLTSGQDPEAPIIISVHSAV